MKFFYLKQVFSVIIDYLFVKLDFQQLTYILTYYYKNKFSKFLYLEDFFAVNVYECVRIIYIHK